MSGHFESNSYGGTRVDEMLPPEEMQELIAKLTPPPRTPGRRRVGRMAIRLEVFEQIPITDQGEIDE